MSALILPPQLFPSIGYYALINSQSKVCIDSSLRFDKRHKSVHRYEIADARSRLQLTVPIIKPHGINQATWADVGISPHGEWWKLHITALESAYGRTPYFEFLIDKFAGIFCDPTLENSAKNILELNKRADDAIRQITNIQTNIEWLTPSDATKTIVKAPGNFSTDDMEPYHQIRADKLGFIPSLSILDLVFNLGPESTLYLDRLSSQIQSLGLQM